MGHGAPWHDPVVRAVALLALVVALLTGCGGDDSSVVVPYVVGLSEPNAIQVTEEAGLTPLVERGPTTDADSRRWEPFVEAGQIDCAYCGGRIWPGQDWDLGHSVDRQSVAPEHRHCNRATAKRRLRHSREW